MNAAIRTTCIVALTLSVSLAVWRLAGSLRQTAIDADSAVKHADGLVSKLEATADKLNTAADRDSAYYEQASKELPKTARTLRETIDTGRATIDELRLKTIPELNDAIGAIADDVDVVAKKTGTMVDSGTQVLDSANRRVVDTRVDELIDGFHVSQLHVNSMLADGELMTDDARTAVHRWTRPPSTFQRIMGDAWTVGRVLALVPIP